MAVMTGSRKCWLSSGAFVLCALLAGCGGEQEAAKVSPQKPATSAPARATAPAVDAKAEAEQIFATRCVTCHGLAGAGDGPGSMNLSPPPRNFQDPAWQDEVSDEHIANIVQYGGAAVGRSPTMPGNPDLSSKPEVVKALVAHVRGLRSK